MLAVPQDVEDGDARRVGENLQHLRLRFKGVTTQLGSGNHIQIHECDYKPPRFGVKGVFANFKHHRTRQNGYNGITQASP